MNDGVSTRRRYLLTLGTAGVAGLAGCSQNSSSDEEDEDEDVDDEDEDEGDTDTAAEDDAAVAEVPQVLFSWDYRAAGATDRGELTITHDGGDTVVAGNLYVRGQGFSPTTPSTSDSDTSSVVTSSGTSWQAAVDADAATAHGTRVGERAVVSGDYISLSVTNDYDLRVVWEAPGGGTSSTLAQDTGPNTS